MAGPISKSGTSKNPISAAVEEAASFTSAPGCQLSPWGGETAKPRRGWHRFITRTTLRDPRWAEATGPTPLHGHRGEGICRTGDISEGKAAPKPTLGANRDVLCVAQEDLPMEGCSNPLRAARRSPHGAHASGKKRGTLNSRLGSLPDDSQARNSWLGWQSGTFCRCRLHVRGTALKISRMPAPSPSRLPRARFQLCPLCSACCGEGCRNAGSRCATFPSDLQGEVGNRWKELFISFSIFNPAARGWEAVVEEEGGAFQKPTFKPSLQRSGISLTCRTEGKSSRTVSVGWIQQAGLTSVDERGLLSLSMTDRGHKYDIIVTISCTKCFCRTEVKPPSPFPGVHQNGTIPQKLVKDNFKA